MTRMFVVVEALCGWFTHSLALLSDAGYNLADAAALGFSWYALWMSNKPSHQGMTFGVPPRLSAKRSHNLKGLRQI